MNVIYSKENTHVEDSYTVQDKKQIEIEVYWIREHRKGLRYPVRTEKSYIQEWIGHNKLYNLGLFRSHTKDVDLEEKQKIIHRIIWWIIGR